MRNLNKLALASSLILTAMAATPPSALTFAPRGDANAQAEIKKTLAELATTFEAFKSANDERLNAKAEDSLINAKVDKINEAITETEDKLTDLATQVAAAAKQTSTDSRIVDPGYTAAFSAHMRGKRITDEVMAVDLNKGAQDEGGYLAPIEWDRTISDALVETGGLRSICHVQPVSGAGFSRLVNLKGTVSGWVGEAGARAATDTATFGNITYTFGEIYANPAATQQMLDDSAIDLEAWLSNEIREEFAVEENLAFVSGDGTNKPKGLLTYATGGANAADDPRGAIGVIASGGSGVITTDALIDLVYDVADRYMGGASFAMNRKTRGAVRKLVDGDGNLIWERSYQAGEPSTLLGYPVNSIEDMPDIAVAAMPIAFGDFMQGYMVLDRIGTRLIRDPYTNKPYVQFYTTKRVGGGIRNSEALRVLKIDA